MEQHPVPQNVTTFQFRLIGDMTIKQFGYLAGGAILAYIFYKLPLPFFFTWPLALVFGLGGVGFAFVPIEERPMDVWVLSFLKNVYSPTQYVWQKAPLVQPKSPQQSKTPAGNIPGLARPSVSPPPAVSVPVASHRGKSIADVLGGVFGLTGTAVRPEATTPPVAAAVVPPAPAGAPGVSAGIAPGQQRVISDIPKQGPLDWFTQLFVTKKTAQTPMSVSPPRQAPTIPTPPITGRRLDVSPPPAVSSVSATKQIISEVQQKETALEGKVEQLKHELENKSMTEARILELQKQLTEVLTQKDRMEKEVLALRAKAAADQAAPAPPAQPAQTPRAPTGQTHVATPPGAVVRPGPTVKIITPEGAVKAGLPRLTTFPNVVTGIIKDSDNNLLPGVLVTVKDKDGVPLRALKTNRLGQFAASTPLANGVYFVEIEDPRVRFAFDRVQITLNGSIVPALEIIAKSQKEISRAKLAKELFGTNQ